MYFRRMLQSASGRTLAALALYLAGAAGCVGCPCTVSFNAEKRTVGEAPTESEARAVANGMMQDLVQKARSKAYARFTLPLRQQTDEAAFNRLLDGSNVKF